MINSYCPNCHRQLREIDVELGFCGMCGNLSTNPYTQAEMTIEEISKKISEMEEYKRLQEMKEKKQIEEAVIITHPKNTNFIANTGIKYVIFSYFCEENKIYMVTDEKLKQAIKDKIDKGE